MVSHLELLSIVDCYFVQEEQKLFHSRVVLPEAELIGWYYFMFRDEII